LRDERARDASAAMIGSDPYVIDRSRSIDLRDASDAYVALVVAGCEPSADVGIDPHLVRLNERQQVVDVGSADFPHGRHLRRLADTDVRTTVDAIDVTTATI
jgi:hypothetical protein